MSMVDQLISSVLTELEFVGCTLVAGTGGDYWVGSEKEPGLLRRVHDVSEQVFNGCLPYCELASENDHAAYYKWRG